MKLDLKTWRIKAGLTQKKLAVLMGVTEQTIAKWENYETFLKSPQLIKFAEITGARLEDIKLTKDS